MSDLFKKLNTLVKASINDVLGDAVPGRSRRTPDPLSGQMDREVKILRERINEAIAYEDTLQARVDSLRDESARLDHQADEAVTRGSDATARHLVEQLQRVQQRLNMAEADLREHQLVAQELIQRVNLLEAILADARRANMQEQPEPHGMEDDSSDLQSTDSTQATHEISTRMQALSNVIKDAQEKIGSMGDKIKAKEEITTSLTPDDYSPDDTTIDDDLATRRQRLSKR